MPSELRLLPQPSSTNSFPLSRSVSTLLSRVGAHVGGMTSSFRLFDRLDADLRHRLRAPSTQAAAARWATAEPALAGIVTAPDTLAESAPGRNPGALAALVRLADGDRLAADAVFVAVLPGLRAVATGISRRWGVPRGEADQDVAAAGWARIVTCAGADLAWPAQVIVGGARDTVRDRLRRAACTARRTVPISEVPDLVAPEDGDGEASVDAADLLARAAASGVIDPRAAGLVWATRVRGVPIGDLVGDRREAKTLVMRRLRAESALRAAN